MNKKLQGVKQPNMNPIITLEDAERTWWISKEQVRAECFDEPFLLYDALGVHSVDGGPKLTATFTHADGRSEHELIIEGHQSTQ